MQSKTSRRLTRVTALALLAASAAVAIALLVRPSGPSLALQAGTPLPRPQALPEFELLDHRGEAFTRASLEGQWTLLFTGFTNCPDVCPATLAVLAVLGKRLRDSGGQLGTVFLSVDPGHDTPEVLADYVAHFDARLVGATGDAPEIGRLVEGLGFSYIRIPAAEGRYTIDHSAALALVDPEGRLSAWFRPPLDPGRIAADLAPLVGARR